MTHRRPRGQGARRHLGHARGRRGRGSTSPSCAPPTRSRPSAPAGCAWSRSTAPRARRPRARRRAPTAWSSRPRPSRCSGCAQRHGALPLRPPRRLRGLRPRQLRDAGAGGHGRLPSRCATAAGRDHLAEPAHDASNPYFDFDPATCIVCSRCVRACDEIQGTFALTIEGRGFDSTVTPGGTDFLSSECVSCGACVQACPTSTLQEKSLRRARPADPRRSTPPAPTAASAARSAPRCRAGEDTQVVRMMPAKNGGANEGHSCVKGRFAYGYATHPDRQLHPMVRETIDDEWRVVSWDEAIAQGRRRLLARSRPSTASARSAASPPRAAPTRRSTSSRRWSGRRSATTTSTPAPGSATPPPATA